MVAYVRSGESVAVLVLSLITFLAVLAVVARQPWAATRRTDGSPEQPWDDAWRCGHDLVWDRQGVQAVAVGDRLPQRVVWSRIDGVDSDRHRAAIDDRAADWRRAVHLDLYRPDGHPGPDELWLCVGPDQDPDVVATELERAWRRVAARRWYPEPDPEPDPGRRS